MSRTAWLTLAAVVLILTGIIITFRGHATTLRWAAPPIPPAWAVGVTQPPAQRGSGPVSRSSPVRIDIPAIKVHAKIIPLGLNRNGSVQIPPLSDARLAGWYDKGPTPGQRGAAAILGHVDARSIGPAVFYKLGNLRPGAKIYVTLHDGRTVVFDIYSVALYPKTRFPTVRVYGYTTWPTLRLITCGGIFDRQTGHYLGNVVAFASYVGSKARV